MTGYKVVSIKETPGLSKTLPLFDAGQISRKHDLALFILDMLGEPNVCLPHCDDNCRVVMGRNTAYEFMSKWGYEWSGKFDTWVCWSPSAKVGRREVLKERRSKRLKK